MILKEKYLLIDPSFLTEYAARYNVIAQSGQLHPEKTAGLYEDLQAIVKKSHEILSIDGDGNAHIKIQGVLSPGGIDIFDAYIGQSGTSYNTIFDKIYEAEKVTAQNKTIFLDINSPGGTVEGVDITWQAIKDVSTRRNVVAVNHNYIASAAYYLASAALKIEAQNPTVETGSIGVCVVTYSYKGLFEQWGIKEIVITNHESSEKLPDLSTDDGQAVIRQELDDLYKVFTSRVANFMKCKPEEAYAVCNTIKGRMLVAARALETGLISSIQKDISKQTASAGKISGGRMETLEQILAANPLAASQYEKAIEKAEKASFEKGTESVKAEFKKIAAFAGNKTYEGAVQMQIAKALAGEASCESVTVAVTMQDIIIQQNASTAAKIESENTDVAVDDGKNATVSQDGVIRTAADLEKFNKIMKGEL